MFCMASAAEITFFFFKHIHRVSDACTCTITKIKLTNKGREEKGEKQNTLGEPRGDETFKGQEWIKIGSHNRERQRERQL